MTGHLLCLTYRFNWRSGLGWEPLEQNKIRHFLKMCVIHAVLSYIHCNSDYLKKTCSFKTSSDLKCEVCFCLKPVFKEKKLRNVGLKCAEYMKYTLIMSKRFFITACRSLIHHQLFDSRGADVLKRCKTAGPCICLRNLPTFSGQNG